ncbi:MAG: lactate utilization protein [Deltaproteobacteria bacterium]|nr:lactate utilization protein [Deltaproteobacteria bacterium]
MDSHQIKWNEQIAKKVIEQLDKRGMEGSYAATAAQAKEEIIAMIPQGSKVYRCGSMTAVSMDLWQRIAKIPRVEIIDPFQPGLSFEDSLERRREGLTADLMITSTNAITVDGKLVNLDGLGNRAAAMIFGPQKVILVVGMNKVVPDVDSAISRTKNYSAPVNAMRMNIPTPCAEDGICVDCKTPARICNIWSIIEGQRIKGRIHVKLVGENLGY